MTTYSGPKIETFKEVFDWITYDLDNNYELRKVDGGFVVNKLYITKTELSYKTELFELAPGLYEKVLDLWRLFQNENSIRFIQEEE